MARMIERPGTTGEFSETWGDKRAVYYCNLCEDEPNVDPDTEVPVQLVHDACVWKSVARGTSEMTMEINRIVFQK